VAETQQRYSQRGTQLVPETQLSALSQLSKTPSIELSPCEDSPGSSFTKSSTNNDAEPRRSGRVKRPTRDAASQLSQDRAAAALAAAKSPKGKKVRKAKLMNTSQLIEEFSLG